MGRTSFWNVLTRVVAVIAGVLLVGLVLRLIGGIFAPILPPELMQLLTDGWSRLYGLVSPAAAAIGALALIVALVWIIAGRR